MPHVNMMRAIQTRAPNLLSARLLGTSKKKYPMKKIPAAPPNAAALSARSLLIAALAKPMFTRSRIAMKRQTARIGTRRQVTLSRVRRSSASASLIAIAAPVMTLSMRWSPMVNLPCG